MSESVPVPMGPARARTWATAVTAGRRASLIAFALYLLVTAAAVGRHAIAHPTAIVIAPDDIDSSQYQWFLAWWPYAILHSLDPFVTHLVFVPGGYNLTWTTSMAGPAILLSPLTLLFGPTVAFNAFGILAPAVSAWVVFLLCRHVTGRLVPSVLGGLVFCLSGFEMTTTQGEPWLAAAALLPAAVLLILRWLESRAGDRALVAGLALAIALQFLTSAESLATATGFGILMLVSAVALGAMPLRAVRALVARIALAYAIAAVLISPFLVAMLGPHPIPNQTFGFSDAPTDPVALIMPGVSQAGGPWQAAHLARLGLPPGQDSFAFLGLPVVVIVLAFLATRWRERRARLLGAAFVAGVVAVLGGQLVVVGHTTGIPLPWTVVHDLPLMRYAVPMRMAVYPALAAAVIVALWLSRVRAVTATVAALLIVASMLPSPSNPGWRSAAADPAFFDHGTYRHFLHPADNVLTIPAVGPNERWQARTGFAFRIVGGYLGAYPAAYTRYRAWDALLAGRPSVRWPADLRAYIAAKHVTAIVVDARLGLNWPRLLAGLQLRPERVGQVLFYRVRQP